MDQKLSPRDQEILAYASEEVSPGGAEQFEPVAPGFLIAALGVVFFGALGVVVMVWDLVFGKVWGRK